MQKRSSGIPGVPRENLKPALGGALMVLALVVLILFIVLQGAREVVAMVGTSLLLLAWMVITVKGIHQSQYVAVNVVSTVGFAFWAAFVTALGLSPGFREGVLSVGVWLGIVAIMCALLYPAIMALKNRPIPRTRGK